MQKNLSILTLKTILLILSGIVCIVFSAEAQKSKYRGKAKPKSKVIYSARTSSKYRSKTAYRKPTRSSHLVSSVIVSNPTIVRSQAAFSFTSRWYDFGDVIQGEKVTHTFPFKNTGKDPLIISVVQPTCGCTVTEWTRTPIPPGQSGDITVTFDSKSSLNQQNKTITVVSNAATGNERLYIQGNVLPKR
ncbi:DUF1573 domain-containing protein [Cytophagaceae bacterium YF14B1]|uniref:DUF1573 domain-containing protein n=1 Tax=Xanthocytophaga flava TaxID=3048013 RepID=A0AAE3QS48_9BACT|nr:DUF1573 domain-containing protein [Xanthocytophaga flavus]MDJ1484447.1 DUF1573 domain-containing protein [Xanthocytophaga flavus]